MKWIASIRDVLYLNFAVVPAVIRLLVPTGSSLVRRELEGREWRFLSLLFLRNDGLGISSSSVASLRVNQPDLPVCLIAGCPFQYLGAFFLPRIPLQGTGVQRDILSEATGV